MAEIYAEIYEVLDYRTKESIPNLLKAVNQFRPESAGKEEGFREKQQRDIAAAWTLISRCLPFFIVLRHVGDNVRLFFQGRDHFSERFLLFLLQEK